jgi:hypothetical protein
MWLLRLAAQHIAAPAGGYFHSSLSFYGKGRTKFPDKVPTGVKKGQLAFAKMAKIGCLPRDDPSGLATGRIRPISELTAGDVRPLNVVSVPPRPQ